MLSSSLWNVNDWHQIPTRKALTLARQTKILSHFIFNYVRSTVSVNPEIQSSGSVYMKEIKEVKKIDMMKYD